MFDATASVAILQIENTVMFVPQIQKLRNIWQTQSRGNMPPSEVRTEIAKRLDPTEASSKSFQIISVHRSPIEHTKRMAFVQQLLDITLM
jgi:hypothetical protein